MRRGNEDGSFSSNGQYTIAETALAGMAFMASGSTPSSGEYSNQVKRAVGYFSSLYEKAGEPDRWYITADKDNSRLHGHGYALTFLSIAYGEYEWEIPIFHVNIPKLINASIQLSELSQVQGGWGYTPIDTSPEITTVVSMLQGLREAKGAGFRVNSETINRAVEYLKQSAVEQGEFTTFKYTISFTEPQDSFPIAAAALSALNATGHYSIDYSDQNFSRLIKKGLNYLRYNPPGFKRENDWYGHLHAAQAMFQAGEDEWGEWSHKIYPMILDEQQKDGSWESGGPNTTPIFSTAVATFILSLSYQLLPAFQR